MHINILPVTWPLNENKVKLFHGMLLYFCWWQFSLTIDEKQKQTKNPQIWAIFTLMDLCAEDPSIHK